MATPDGSRRPSTRPPGKDGGAPSKEEIAAAVAEYAKHPVGGGRDIRDYLADVEAYNEYEDTAL